MLELSYLACFSLFQCWSRVLGQGFAALHSGVVIPTLLFLCHKIKIHIRDRSGLKGCFDSVLSFGSWVYCLLWPCFPSEHSTGSV